MSTEGDGDVRVGDGDGLCEGKDGEREGGDDAEEGPHVGLRVVRVVRNGEEVVEDVEWKLGLDERVGARATWIVAPCALWAPDTVSISEFLFW